MSLFNNELPNNPLPPLPEPVSSAQAAAAEADSIKNEVGIGEALGASSMVYDIGAAATRWWYSPGVEADWKATHIDDLTNLLRKTPYEQHDDILASPSWYDAQVLQKEVEYKTQTMDRIGQEGAMGLVGLFGVGILEMAPLTMATGGLSAVQNFASFAAGGSMTSSIYNAARVAKAGNRAVEASRIAASMGRGELIMRGMGHGVAASQVYMAIEAATNPMIESHDFGTAALFAGALGGAANGFFGRSLIKNALIKNGLKYEARLQAGGAREVAVRFGADNLIQQVGERFGVNEDDAGALLVGVRSMIDPHATTGSFEDLAVAGVHARLRGGQTVVERTVGQVKGKDAFVLETLNDGKIILRSMATANNEEGFVRGVAGVIRRRIFNEDNPLLTNTEVVVLDEVVSGVSPPIPRTVRLTIGAEGGKAPTGVQQWEVRLGENVTKGERRSVKRTPAAEAARSELKEARADYEKKFRAYQTVYEQETESLTEADHYQAFVMADRLAQTKPERIELLRAAQRLNSAEKALKQTESIELIEQLAQIKRDRQAAVNKVRAEYKAINAKYRAQLDEAKGVKTDAVKAAKKNLDAAAAAEKKAVERLDNAELAAGELDRENLILRRKTPWTPQEENRFAQAFLSWMRNNPTEGAVPSNYETAFTKIRGMLVRMFTDATDPEIAGTRVNSQVEMFFRNVIKRHTDDLINKAEKESISDTFARINRIAVGVPASGEKAVSTVEPNSLPVNWSDTPKVDTKVLGMNFSGLLRWLNQGVAAANSEVGSVGWLANRMFWFRVAPVDELGNMVPQRSTIMERIGRLRRQLESKLAVETKNGFLEYATGKVNPDQATVSEKLAVSWKHNLRSKFSEEVHNEIISPGSSSNPAIKKVAKSYADHFEKMRAMAEEAGIPGFVGLEADRSYFPRLWHFDMIDDFTKGKNNGGVTELARIIRESISLPIVESETDPLVVAGKALTSEGRDKLALYVAERLRQISRGERKNEYIDIDELTSAWMSENFPKAPKRPEGASLTPRGRRRVPMDISKRVVLDNGTSVSLSDFVAKDVLQATEAYNRSVLGAVGEKVLLDEFKDQLVARGKLTAEQAAEKINTWEDVKAFIRSHPDEGRQVPIKQLDRYIGHLDELMSAIRGEPHPQTFGTVFSQYLGRLMRLAYLQRGQAFSMAAAAETGRIIGRTSFSSMQKQMPIIGELAAAAKRGNIDPDQMQLLKLFDQALGTASDRTRRTMGHTIENRLGSYPVSVRAGWWNKLDNWFKNTFDPNLHAAGSFFSDVTGLAPITSATQHLMTASLVQEVFDKTGSVYSNELLAQWGLTRNEFDRIRGLLKETAVVNKAGRVVDINFKTWDPMMHDRFLDFLERGTISSIQDAPTRGDFAKSFYGEFGRILSQFRTFNIKGINNFLMTSIQRNDERTYAEFMATGMLATVTQMARKVIFAPTEKTPKELDKYWQQSFSPQAYLQYFASGPAETYLLMGATDSVLSAILGYSPIANNVRYSGQQGSWFDVSATPAYSVLDGARKAIQAPIQALIRDNKDFTRKDLNSITSLIPFRRVLGIGTVANKLENELGNMLNLPTSPTPKK